MDNEVKRQIEIARLHSIATMNVPQVDLRWAELFRANDNLRRAALEFQHPALKLARDLAVIQKPLIEMSRKLVLLTQPIFEAFDCVRPHLAETFLSLEPVLRRLALEDEKCKRLESVGWLPHGTSPWEALVDEGLGDEELQTLISEHYRENWDAIKSEFLASIADCEIDDEAKDTFREALEAHEKGLYRCPPRLIFPEIERVARVELHDNSLESISSQRKLRDAIGSLTPADMEPQGMAGHRLFMKLTRHLYAQVKDEDALVKMLADPVPNRHAAVHGLASYNSFQSSINILILCDFVFQGISACKRVGDQIGDEIEEAA